MGLGRRSGHRWSGGRRLEGSLALTPIKNAGPTIGLRQVHGICHENLGEVERLREGSSW